MYLIEANVNRKLIVYRQEWQLWKLINTKNVFLRFLSNVVLADIDLLNAPGKRYITSMGLLIFHISVAISFAEKAINLVFTVIFKRWQRYEALIAIFDKKQNLFDFDFSLEHFSQRTERINLIYNKLDWSEY